jgi:MinD superfamily P-loop ATPase
VILDAPPGTSCAAIAALRGADFVLLVAEPTPFGLHDLSLIMRTVRELDLPCGVVVNRAGCGDDRVQAYCRTHAVPLLGEIPDDRRIAEAYAHGTMLVDALPAYEPLFRDLAAGIMECSRSAKFKRSGT